MNNIQIASERFIIKSLSVRNNLSNYLDWLSNPHEFPFILGTKKNYRLVDLKKYINENNEDENSILLGIFDKINLEHVGNIRYHNLDFTNKKAFLGILIGKEKYRGIGVATEVITTSMNWIYSKFKISTIVLGVHSENTAARKLYEKLGFKYTDTSNDPSLIMTILLNSGA